MPIYEKKFITRDLNGDDKNAGTYRMNMTAVIKNSRGATAVEFAIVCPLLMTLIFGIIEFGLFMFNKQVLTNAAREGARAGIVVRADRLSNDDIQAIVLDSSSRYLVTFGSGGLPVVTLLPPDNDPSDGFDPSTNRCTSFECDLRVTVNYRYDFMFLSLAGVGPVNIRAVSTMRME